MMVSKAFTFLCCVVLINLSNAQDQTGFISIDCGLQPDNSSYTESSTGIDYVSDSSYTDTGTNSFVAPEYRANMMQSMWSVRSFPEGSRNCYTIGVNITAKYLIRAAFMYGNYDTRNELPGFDLHLGPNKWDSVKLESSEQTVSKEIIYSVLTDTLQVCLVNTGNGTPFISVLELRQLPDSSYATKSESLQLFQRLDFGSSTNLTVRYPDDVFDRKWFPSTPNGSKQLSELSTSPPSRNSSGKFQLPQAVMRTAVIPETTGGSVDFGWTPDDPSLEFYFYLYFTELQEPSSGSVARREFIISLNGNSFGRPFSLDYLETLVLSISNPLSEQSFQFSISQTRDSTLPPLINAMEAYFVNKLPQSSTDQNDLSAMRNIKSAYKVKRNWEGDTCVPQAYTWEGVNCTYSGTSMPRVISLNLSSAGLTGDIASDISLLTRLQVLDLSNNNLTGPVPDFLAQLQFLRVLNLANNQLSGPIPSILMRKSGLSISIEGNPSICAAGACEELSQTKSKKKKLPGFVIPLVASLAGLILIATISAAILFIFIRKKKQGRTVNRTITASSNGPSLLRRDTGSMPRSMQRRETGFTTRPSLQRIESGMTDDEVNETAVDSFDMEPANRKFTYAEIVNITNGFERDQGKVGFGRNYLGQLNGKEVTVKVVSSLSSQGYKQLRAEVKHLFRIHHKNLITMLGYCNEGDKLAVIYEYMANGNLKQHISESSPTVFSWEDRLGIAVDVAQGLEYLHTGCTPPIIHRNVKCTNVFLDENFNAKLGGFGLSRAFDAAEGSHMNTAIAGTPGYVDPEYYTSNILTEKSDVYSFGVVLLEIVTAKPAIIKDEERMHISQWVESLLHRENIEEILDPSLCGDYDLTSAFKTVEIAVACVCRNSGDRPGMSRVVTALKESLAAEVERKKDLPVVSTDSVEDLALGFGSNPPPRLR
ncbi:Leucine-rich repeat protein kinase family protein [Raphanus sativus]|uniref:non-specific serine/threonine protein kinase n=1 Tax=Raphanus sativus TaxID=3726 RepID=A0A6J0P1G6_RAPSA|nr:probable LRR receptor-like serine/threonine-protein kinase At1g51880 [Raphanus sativus]KAJ4896665.1 Leucine-rich repeat protein kinase family protein [Raphanus sativus]